METFNLEAIYIIKGDTSLSSDQEEMLAKCYLPIIGNNPYSLYHVFLYNRKETYFTFEVINSISGLNIVEFTNSMHFLEAIGLVGTYFKQDKDKITYIINLFLPSTPKTFFKNVLLTSLLVQKVGKRKFNAIKNSLLSKEVIPDGFFDISSKFEDVFKDVVADFSSLEINLNLKDYVSKEIETRFDKNEFISKIKELQIDPKILEKDLVDIERLSSLFGLSTIVASNFIKKYCIDSYGEFSIATFKKFAENYSHYKLEDIQESKQEVFGTSDFSKRAKLMEEMAPLKYLQSLLGVSAPSSYKQILDRLSKEYNCPNSVINTSIDYTIKKCKGSLPEQYLTKVLVSLLSNKINNASDAMAFLYQKEASYIKKKSQDELDTSKLSLSSSDDNQNNSNNNEDELSIDEILGDDDI